MIPFPHPMFGRTGSVTYAQTAWLFPGAAGTINTGGYGWNNPGGVTADDTSRATTSNTIGAGASSNYLRCSHFGFAGESIPSDATITGIEARISRWAGAAGSASDNEVILADYTDFDPLSLNRAATGIGWPTSEAIRTYGGSADAWGLTLTKALIESNNFALLLKVQTNPAGTAVAVNYVQLRAHYYF